MKVRSTLILLLTWAGAGIRTPAAWAADARGRVAVSTGAAAEESARSARTHLEGALIEAGFEVVEPALGAETEFLVVLECSTSALPPDGGRSYRQATVRYRVVDVPAAARIAAGSARETGWGTSDDEAGETAVKYAAVKAARDIAAKLRQRVTRYADCVTVVSLEVRDVAEESVLKELAGRLARAEAIELVNNRQTGRQSWEIRLFSTSDASVVGAEVERVLAETEMGTDRVRADRFVLIGQAVGERGAVGGPAVVACLPVANRTGRAELDPWAESLPDLIHQELLALPGHRLVERRVVGDVLQEADLVRVVSVDESARRRLGELTGADRLAAGELTADPSGDLILGLRTVRVIDGELVQVIRVRGAAADLKLFETLIRQALRSPPNSLAADLLEAP